MQTAAKPFPSLISSCEMEKEEEAHDRSADLNLMELNSGGKLNSPVFLLMLMFMPYEHNQSVNLTFNDCWHFVVRREENMVLVSL